MVELMVAVTQHGKLVAGWVGAVVGGSWVGAAVEGSGGTVGKLAAAAAVGSIIGAASIVAALRSAAVAWKEERDAERAKADRVAAEKDALKVLYDELETRFKRLEHSRDFEGAFDKLLVRLDKIDERHGAEHVEILKVIRANTDAIKTMAPELAQIIADAPRALPPGS